MHAYDFDYFHFSHVFLDVVILFLSSPWVSDWEKKWTHIQILYSYQLGWDLSKIRLPTQDLFKFEALAPNSKGPFTYYVMASKGGRGSLKYYILLRGGGGWSNQKLHNNYRPLKMIKIMKFHKICQIRVTIFSSTIGSKIRDLLCHMI